MTHRFKNSEKRWLTFLSIMAEPAIFVTPFFYFCRALFFYQFAVAGVVVAVLLWQLWQL